MQILVHEVPGLIDLTNRETGDQISIFVLRSGTHWIATPEGVEPYPCRRDAMQRAEMLLTHERTVGLVL